MRTFAQKPKATLQATAERTGSSDSRHSAVPPIVHEVLSSSGQPLDSAARASMESRFGHDFSQVRVHNDARAAESARAVHALAYTVGRDVAFGSGQYAPGTNRGNKLLAHELTHTLQQRGQELPEGGLGITTPASPTEMEAEVTAAAALQGKSDSPALNAPLQVARQPADPTPAPPASTPTTPAIDVFANEDPALRRRRLTAISGSQNAIESVRKALAGGYLWDFEVLSSGGIAKMDIGGDETLVNREARLRQLMTDLAFLSTELASAPIPYAWLAPDVEFQEPGERTILGTKRHTRTEPADARLDTIMFYAHRAHGLRQPAKLVWTNWSYIKTDPLPTPAVRRSPTSRGTGAGIYINVPDPKNAPLVYRRVTGYEGWQERGSVIEVWHDDIGYYYNGKDGKIYLPRKP